MSIQDEITAEANAATLGRTYRVLVDGLEDGRPYGRSYREAPEIDGVIEFDTGKPGDFVNVEIGCVRRQIQLLRMVTWWYLLPLYVGKTDGL